MTTCTLIILDGIGLRAETDSNAFAAARTPVLDELMEKHPHCEISTSGLAVGLPEGQMGNSEVGHMNLGAGRVVYQNFTRINKAIADGSFARNAEIVELITKTNAKCGRIHVMGLLSDGGVHSHIDQITAACRVLSAHKADDFVVHAFLDGRDTAPRSAAASVSQLEAVLNELGSGRIATVVGRYFAMDRDNRWQRVESAYRLIVQGLSPYSAGNASDAICAAYERGESDEFVQATRIGNAVCITPNDGVIFMNFRPDRSRQLSQALVDKRFDAFDRQLVLPKAQLLTLTRYSDDLDGPCAFPPKHLANSLGEHMARLGKAQLRIAETEKYAHVTFFFNGGREEPFDREERILIQSPLLDSYDQKPEMSADELTDRLITEIQKNQFDLIVCNYANGDMVGHTGSFDAAVKAVEAVDRCIGRVVKAVEDTRGHCLITADHGNVEQMVDLNTNQVHTSHTLNPVPLIYVGHASSAKHLKDGRLCDIAPTILNLLRIPIPVEMDGDVLVVE